MGPPCEHRLGSLERLFVSFSCPPHALFQPSSLNYVLALTSTCERARRYPRTSISDPSPIAFP